MTNNLKHFGVLGMKWGRRKAQGGGSKSKKGGAKNKTVAKKIGNFMKKEWKKMRPDEKAVIMAHMAAGAFFTSAALAMRMKRFLKSPAGKIFVQTMKSKTGIGLPKGLPSGLGPIFDTNFVD